MTYTCPPSAVARFTTASLANSKARFGTQSGPSVEVEYLEGVGWMVEVRYDESGEGIARQPFTGMQETIRRAELVLEEDAERYTVLASGSSLTIEKAQGKISIAKGEALRFATIDTPFATHAQPVEVYERLMSLKVTDFSFRAPFTPKGEHYTTRMTRFQYPRPTGVVLGLPGQAGEMNRNGYRFELFNTDDYTHIPSRPPLYQSWPILFHRDASERGWVGVFHDNPSRTFVDIGEFVPDTVTFESITGNTRVVIITEDTLHEASKSVIRLFGVSNFPPLWAFGYQQCRWSYMSTNEIREVVSRLAEEKIPCDAIYLDIDHMDEFRVFTADKERFHDLAECLDELKERSIHSVCIVDPGVKVDPDYHAYVELVRSKKVLTNDEGDPFLIKCWPGTSVLPDFADESAREVWAKLQADWLEKYPFDGIWNDMNEPSNFDGGNRSTSRAHSTAGRFDEQYNLYGYHMSKASARGWDVHRPDTRPLIISRSGYPGVQRDAVIWHGDNWAWWEHLRLALDTCIQYSIAGAIYTGADVPGFSGNAPDDLAVRYFQLGAFMPFFRGHSIYFAADKEPYAFSEHANKLIKEAILLRYSLLREWYSQFDLARRAGTPLMEPVFDAENNLVRDHALLFRKLLFAPVIERDETRKLVYLPAGEWYRLGDVSTRISGDQWLVIPVTLSDIPLFVRAGSIIIRNTPQMTTRATFEAGDLMEIYPDASGRAEGYRYDDDGYSKEGATVRERLSVSEDDPQIRVTAL